jgi:hypothetical protein
MPEALAVLAVFVVAVAAWLGAWMQARDPANQNVHDETERLQLHVRWLEQRLDLAERENWGGEMIAGLQEEMQLTSRLLSQRARPEFER